MTWTEQSRQLADNGAHDVTIFVIWHEDDLGHECILHCRALGPEVSVTHLCGKSAPNCAFLWNKAIRECPTRKLIICNQKARPTREAYDKTIALLNQGYAIAGLYRYGFFGSHLRFYQEVGGFDERFAYGGYEDDDIAVRALEANIAIYESEECPYILKPSTWDYRKSRPFWQSKWRIDGTKRTVKRLLGEEPATLSLTKGNDPVSFLTSEHTRYSTSPQHQNIIRKMGTRNVRFV
jgi:hypothetical protein